MKIRQIKLPLRKSFQTKPSLKQHMNLKHRFRENLPVGHPDRLSEQERVTQQSTQYSCNLCGCIFRFPNQIENHMKAHRNNSERPGGFENVNASKICRYFRRGYCAKGSQCEFKHSQAYKNYAPNCNQGPGCRFLSQNRCSFFHQGGWCSKAT